MLSFFPCDHAWIRSGKVDGCSFEARFKEHKKGSCLTTSESLESNFYTKYPSSSVGEENKRRNDGEFEQLKLYCGLGFDPSHEYHKALYLTSAEHAVFDWSNIAIKKIMQVNFSSGSKGLFAKQLTMVAYLCELAYDLSLSKEYNVSESPGFETPLGIFGKQKTNNSDE